MKIRLKSLGIPRSSGYLLQASDFSQSGTTYQAPSNFINEMYFQESTGVIGGERLGTLVNVWIPYRSLTTSVIVQREDKLLIDLDGTKSTTVSSIHWQSGSIIRYTFTAGQDLHLFTINTWYKFESSINSINNGVFKVVGIGANYLDVINTGRTDNTKDETSSTSILTHILPEFEVMDIKREIMSNFEDHYELSIYQKTD